MQDILKGYRVLELAGVLAGPSAGMFLAEQGAEVVKLENPAGGDVTRSWRHSLEPGTGDITAYFSSANWGKQSLAVDLGRPEGRALVHRLIPKVDIVLASYKKGDDRKLEMDYATLCRLNPRLIYGRITGYGAASARIAYDAVLQAESGFMSMNGTPASGPLKMPVALIDILAAHQLKEALLLACLKRERSGEGSLVEVSLFDTAVASLANQATNTLVTGQPPGLQGSLHPNIAPYGETYRCADGRYIILAVGSDRQFADLCRLLILDIYLKPDFARNKDRVLHREELDDLLNEAIARLDSDTLLKACAAHAIPAGKIQTVAEALAQEESLVLSARGAYGVPQAVFSSKPQAILPPPALGEHSREVLTAWAGADSHQLDEWEAAGYIFQKNLPEA